MGSYRVFFALLRRDLKLFWNRFFDELLNAAVIVSFQTLMFGYVVPLLGMPISLITPLFLGSVTLIITSIGYALSLATVYDLHYNKLYTFNLILPISRFLFFAYYIVSLMWRMFFISAPFLLLGKILLGERLDLSNMNFLEFAAHYFLALLFSASFFVCFALAAPFYWFIHNIWPRVLTPLQHLGCAFFPWLAAHAIFPRASYILLFNPMTLLVEGLRTSVIQTGDYLPFLFCFLVLATFTMVNLVILNYFFKKRHDPV